MDYLECAYGTKYYVIYKVNGQINAIHDDSQELTEFKGHLSPFDLNNLEAKVCKLTVGNEYENNLLEPQDALQGHDSDSNLRSQNLEDLTGMGFDVNNYIPIPLVGKATSQQGVAIPTSTPKPRMDADLKISDPTHNRGKVNRVSSFTTRQEQTETASRSSKGGPIKRLNTRGQALPRTSNLRMAREHVIEGQQPINKPNIDVRDPVLVRNHTSK